MERAENIKKISSKSDTRTHTHTHTSTYPHIHMYTSRTEKIETKNDTTEKNLTDIRGKKYEN